MSAEETWSSSLRSRRAAITGDTRLKNVKASP